MPIDCRKFDPAGGLPFSAATLRWYLADIAGRPSDPDHRARRYRRKGAGRYDGQRQAGRRHLSPFPRRCSRRASVKTVVTWGLSDRHSWIVRRGSTRRSGGLTMPPRGRCRSMPILRPNRLLTRLPAHPRMHLSAHPPNWPGCSVSNRVHRSGETLVTTRLSYVQAPLRRPSGGPILRELAKFLPSMSSRTLGRASTPRRGR